MSLFLRGKKLDEQAIVKEYLEDKKSTVIQLANANGVSKDRIRRLLIRHGVEIRQQRHLTDIEKSEIREKYFVKRVGSYSLAREYKVNYATIRKILMKDERFGAFRTILEQEEKESLIRQYLDEDVTHSELAQKYGRTRTWVTRIIRDTEFNDPRYAGKRKAFSERKKTPRKRLRVTADVLIEELKEPDMSQRKLAERYEVSESCIYHAIARYKGKRT